MCDLSLCKECGYVCFLYVRNVDIFALSLCKEYDVCCFFR